VNFKQLKGRMKLIKSGREGVEGRGEILDLKKIRFSALVLNLMK